MEVICAGWGRTGTRSLKYALERLVGQPSYHMQNILLNKKDAQLWHNLIFKDQQNMDWEKIYKGYGACLDFPSCNYYKELMKYYPNSKVILTTRDPQSWIKSWNVLENKVLNSFTFKFMAKIPYTSFYLQKKIHNELIIGKNGAFKGKKSDKDRMKLFDEWNKSVIDYVPQDRLLIYHPKDGWEPICEFLNLPIPNIAYPHLNKTKNMGHMSRFINAVFFILAIGSLLLLLFMFYYFVFA